MRLVILLFSFPPTPTLITYFILREREFFLRNGFVISERGNACREIFSPFTGLPHMLNDFRGKRFVFFLRILHIQDAMLFVFQADATEEMIARIDTQNAVVGIIEAICRKSNKSNVEDTHSTTEKLIRPLHPAASIGIEHIHRLPRGIGDIPDILPISSIVAMKRISTTKQVIPQSVFTLDNLRAEMRRLETDAI